MTVLTVDAKELGSALERAASGEEPRVVLAELCARSSGRAKPSVGRIVHVRKHGMCLAAVITRVCEERNGAVQPLDLHVMSPDGVSMLRGMPRADAEGDDGAWHWPEVR